MFKGVKASQTILELSSVWVGRWGSMSHCSVTAGKPAAVPKNLRWGCGSIVGEEMLLVEADGAWKRGRLQLGGESRQRDAW